MHKILDLENFLNPQLPHIHTLSEQFANAKPFKYIVVDNFLSDSAAEQLLTEFPIFDTSRALTEHGTEGKKATRPDLGQISPFYKAVDSLIASQKFLDYMSQLSGIPDLIYDPQYFGGGTHESRDGQELDVHIDFNYDAASGLYRRLNLLIYLNKDWDSAWGGNIEIHSNPRDYETNQVFAFAPIFNRCMLFETHEHSWHGFDEINLPADKKNLSRKSLSVYFYSKQRPTEEEVPPHTTFYVQRPLPKHIKPGTTLTAKDYSLLRSLLVKRDQWIHYYQNKEMEYNKNMMMLESALNQAKASVRLPTHGYISQIDVPQGYWYDNWTAAIFSFDLKADTTLRGLTISGYRPEYFPHSKAMVFVNNQKVLDADFFPGERADITFNVFLSSGQQATIKVLTELTYNLARNQKSNDDRDLGFLLLRVTGIH